MKKNDKKNYIVVHLTETDGDVAVHQVYSDEALKSYLERQGLQREEYTLIEGGQIKTNY